MKRVFVDTNIPMYWGGAESVYKEPCGHILGAVAREELYGAASAEVFQEILYRFWYLKDMDNGWRIFDHFKTIISEVLPVTSGDVRLARTLSEKYSFSPRDLLHLAVMNNNDIDTIISADKDFDQVDAIQRVDPLNFEDWLAAMTATKKSDGGKPTIRLTPIEHKDQGWQDRD